MSRWTDQVGLCVAERFAFTCIEVADAVHTAEGNFCLRSPQLRKVLGPAVEVDLEVG